MPTAQELLAKTWGCDREHPRGRSRFDALHVEVLVPYGPCRLEGIGDLAPESCKRQGALALLTFQSALIMQMGTAAAPSDPDPARRSDDAGTRSRVGEPALGDFPYRQRNHARLSCRSGPSTGSGTQNF